MSLSEGATLKNIKGAYWTLFINIWVGERVISQLTNSFFLLPFFNEKWSKIDSNCLLI